MRHVSMLPSLLTLGNFTCGLMSVVLCASALLFHGRAEQNHAIANRLAPAAQGVLVDPPTEYPAGLADGLRRQAENHKTRSNELFILAGLMIFSGMFFDMLDGRVARMTNSESRFGAELDSLADGCTFGIAPAMMTATLWLMAQPDHKNWYGQVLLFAAVYSACAVLRLARYNVEIGTGDNNRFTGLPSPAAAGCVASLALLSHIDGAFDPLWNWAASFAGVRMEAPEIMARAIALYALLVGYLMVTRMSFVHIMNRYLTGRRKFQLLVLIVFLALLVVEFPWVMLFLAFNGYLAASLGAAAWRWRFRLRGRWRAAATAPSDPEDEDAPTANL